MALPSLQLIHVGSEGLGPHIYCRYVCRFTEYVYLLIVSTPGRAECTPVEAVFCDEGFNCQSGKTGYTCGELPAAAIVSVVATWRICARQHTMANICRKFETLKEVVVLHQRYRRILVPYISKSIFLSVSLFIRIPFGVVRYPWSHVL